MATAVFPDEPERAGFEQTAGSRGATSVGPSEQLLEVLVEAAVFARDRVPRAGADRLEERRQGGPAVC